MTPQIRMNSSALEAGDGVGCGDDGDPAGSGQSNNTDIDGDVFFIMVEVDK